MRRIISRNDSGLFELSDIALALGGSVTVLGEGFEGTVEISEIVIDSRNVGVGDMFVALKGSHADGETYISDAFSRGAAAVLCRYGAAARCGVRGIYIEVDDPLTSLVTAAGKARRDSGFTVVGITGSVGKTTVKELCIGILSEWYPTDGTRENYNNILGVSLSILNAFGVKKMHELRGKSHKNQKKHLVLELGISRVGEMEGLAMLALPDFAVITNVGSMHVEYLGSREGIAAEKARIALFGVKAVVCPHDTVLLQELTRYVTRDRIIPLYYSDLSDTLLDCGGGVASAAGVERIGNVDGRGRYTLGITNGDGIFSKYGEFTAPIVGEHGIFDSALASVLGVECGLGEKHIQKGLSMYSAAPLRQEIRHDGGLVRIVDCYNSGPESVRAGLSAMDEYARAYGCCRRIAVLGDMLELGEGAEKAHYELGASLGKFGVDMLFAVGELAEMIAIGAVENGFSASAVTFFGRDMPYDLIKRKIELRLRKGDIILYKASRGMELERLV